MKKEERKAAAKKLVAMCNDAHVKLPTDPVNAMVEAGTMLQATMKEDSFDFEAAMEGLKERFGLKKSAPKRKKKVIKQEEQSEEEEQEDDDVPKGKKKRARKTRKVKEEEESEEDEDTDEKKPRKKSKAACASNQDLCEAIAELVGYEFKSENKFKGIQLSKAAKSLREFEGEITSGKQALKLKFVGKSTAGKIDEFLKSGKIEKLEQYRAGNL